MLGPCPFVLRSNSAAIVFEDGFVAERSSRKGGGLSTFNLEPKWLRRRRRLQLVADSSLVADVDSSWGALVADVDGGQTTCCSRRRRGRFGRPRLRREQQVGRLE